MGQLVLIAATGQYRGASVPEPGTGDAAAGLPGLILRSVRAS